VNSMTKYVGALGALVVLPDAERAKLVTLATFIALGAVEYLFKRYARPRLSRWLGPATEREMEAAFCAACGQRLASPPTGSN